MSDSRTVTLHGKPLPLSGTEIQVGDKAPDFAVLDNDLKEFKFSSLRGKVRIVLSVGSLDTSVCDLETRRFNEEAASLGDGLRVLVISMDLPFAQKRWCAAAGVERVMTLSDHRQAAFGQAYGMLLAESRMLARAVFIIDANDIVRYVQLVPEIAQEPDYDAVLRAAKEIL
jgi:thiol peroxidase